MAHKLRKNLAMMSAVLMILVASLLSASSANANGSFWTGDPDPYECNIYEDCFWTMKVCIHEITYVVGIYVNPGDEDPLTLQIWADLISGTDLTVGKCEFSYTGRWVHTYVGRTWSCNLVSAADEDPKAARFSDISYVKDTCGVHPVLGPFDGTAEYTLCREKYAQGAYFCGNRYDTSE